MVSTVHMMTGAAVATMTGQWWLVAPIAIGLHYFEDMLPHVDPSIKTWPLRKWLIAASVDFLLGLVLVLLAVGDKLDGLVVLGVFMSILPDVLSVMDYFFPTGIGMKYRRWHKSLQNKNKSWVGVVYQVVIFGLAVYLVINY